jgi:hypothetical protein
LADLGFIFVFDGLPVNAVKVGVIKVIVDGLPDLVKEFCLGIGWCGMEGGVEPAK